MAGPIDFVNSRSSSTSSANTYDDTMQRKHRLPSLLSITHAYHEEESSSSSYSSSSSSSSSTSSDSTNNNLSRRNTKLLCRMKGCIRRVLKLQHHHQHQQTKASSLSSPSTITNRNEQNDKKNSNHHNKIQSPRSTMMNGQSSFDVSYARLSYNNEIDDFTNGYID